jgi:hypothetical protein
MRAVRVHDLVFGTARAVLRSSPFGVLTMLIRSTRHACFVELRNGLTLELCYDLDGNSAPSADAVSSDALRAMSRSQGVWMFQEEVLLEVKVGQA